MPTPSADAFAALARSSPWRWTTLRFTVRWARDESGPGLVRAWLRRPDALRVETEDGQLLQAGRQAPQQVGVLGRPRGRTVTLPWSTDPGAPQPVLRPDGLVAERPSRCDLDVDAPMYWNYFWVAMLDPVELADGRDAESGAAGSPIVVDGLAEVTHAGRPAWEAVVRPTAVYDPRCSCCPLLHSRVADLLEASGGAPIDVSDPSGYADAYRVRLDVGTGVCVYTEEIGGPWAGAGHVLRIEAVDEPMDDGLFAPRRSRFRRR